MINPLIYHRKVKNEQHVFIFCVAGRSSSTAFQRIINSSNTVWIWGERNGIVDDAVSLINLMKTYRESHIVKQSLTDMYDSYTNNKHLKFYPNAIGNLDSTIDVLSSSISILLKPWATKLKRFGFKDIKVKDTKTLVYLREIFPQSFIVFCFRDPLKQWPSIQKLQGWWDYSKALPLFLDEYYRVSSILLEFASSNNVQPFIENSDLRDYQKVDQIIKYLNIPKIDADLIDVTVNSTKADPLSKVDEEIILSSDAYKNYLKMKGLSRLFYQE